ncbi:MAG: sigma 54-interacting transcriptional regulator [Methylobacter sp.]|uniref:Sigma 54-interacting transcriptional regulator n=1 Tax=Candidatus Methylobacter titanis TaxID=3053457 RepID=A0AA43Q3E1_9GAMM|nr:sigma 54-interacting transcriptional regulator [Candidatus Methylobacter titanis]MDI1292260.1 sigma 54-interacting transcriptional regulator [Candidatus Methylobacter titanis]
MNKPLSAWLQHQPLQPLFLKLLALCDVAGLYIVDQDQQIVHWSQGAEQLSGLRADDLTGKTCLPEYAITDGSDHQKQLIKSSKSDQYSIELQKLTQALYDHEGIFAGGIGLLLPASEQQANMTLSKSLSETAQSFHGLLSRSPAMQAVFQIIQNAAETEATVLVRGESGSGKELVAKAIHDLSARRNAPFLAINCAALSSSLLDSELFGHVRGAFTGAVKDHRGLFQRAHGGTLFLDEVAELPLELQAKLLRVIQERNFIPVGGDRSIDVDVRIVAATHRSLREEVKNGRFREDLMYRLRVVPIFIPPLRERREDISLLIWHFIQQHNAANFRKIEKIDPQAMRALLDYVWPGNIRELHNVVEYAFAVGRGTTLRWSELPPEFRESRTVESQTVQNLPLSAEEEAASIRQALERSHGKVTQAALTLGMSRATFWRKRKIYGV